MLKYNNSEYFENLYIIIQDIFSDISRSDASRIVRELILSPYEDTININEKSFNKIDIIEYLSQFINSSTEEEINNHYKELLDKSLKIIKHMNDGYITKEDFKERNELIKYINNKEFLLYFLLSLRYEFLVQQDNDDNKHLIFKITQLRELNDLITNYTKDEFETATDKEEYEKAKIIYKILKSLQTLGYGYTLSKKEKENMGINHDNDEDIHPEFEYFNQIKRLTLFQIERELDKHFSDSETLETIEDVFMEEIENNN